MHNTILRMQAGLLRVVIFMQTGFLAPRRIWLLTIRASLLALVLNGPGAVAQDSYMTLTTSTIEAANEFLASLDEDQRSRVHYGFDDEERLNWHFIPRERNGLNYHDMDEQQAGLANALLFGLLSDDGRSTVESIRSLELVLKAIETNGRFVRDPDRYHFTLFGEPSMDSNWALRFEGHHIALNWTFVSGTGIASSPQFFGTNPAEVRQGSQQGLRVLAPEEDMARELMQSMNTRQQLQAIISDEAPRDILTGAEVDITPMSIDGIGFDQLNNEQQQLLIGLVEQVANKQAPHLASTRMSQIFEQGIEYLRFAWMGPTARGEPHYYRIHGPGFLIEYDNVQNGANHVHLVWRDYFSDFGTDLLRLHYETIANLYGPGHNH